MCNNSENSQMIEDWDEKLTKEEQEQIDRQFEEIEEAKQFEIEDEKMTYDYVHTARINNRPWQEAMRRKVLESGQEQVKGYDGYEIKWLVNNLGELHLSLVDNGELTKDTVNFVGMYIYGGGGVPYFDSRDALQLIDEFVAEMVKEGWIATPI